MRFLTVDIKRNAAKSAVSTVIFRNVPLGSCGKELGRVVAGWIISTSAYDVL